MSKSSSSDPIQISACGKRVTETKVLSCQSDEWMWGATRMKALRVLTNKNVGELERKTATFCTLTVRLSCSFINKSLDLGEITTQREWRGGGEGNQREIETRRSLALMRFMWKSILTKFKQRRTRVDISRDRRFSITRKWSWKFNESRSSREYVKRKKNP